MQLKDTHTGNTLSGGKRQITLPKVDYPRPNIHAALKSNVKGEEDKIASGLAALHHEDPTFLHMVDSELRQTIVSAQGELHLEVVQHKLLRDFRLNVKVHKPRVSYRETVARARVRGRARASRSRVKPSMSARRTANGARTPLNNSVSVGRRSGRLAKPAMWPAGGSSAAWPGCGRGSYPGLGRVCLRRRSCGSQARSQAPSRRVSPCRSMVRRLIAAQRVCSQALFFSAPR